MSIERKNTDRDPLVADTYRALANERTPDHLNEKVLRMAARESRTRYSVARSWTRPLAWAATIGLSLAIVLELTRLPETEPDVVPVMTPAARKPASTAIEGADGTATDDFAPKDMAVLREVEKRARAQAGPDEGPAIPRADVDEASPQSAPTPRVVAEAEPLHEDTAVHEALASREEASVRKAAAESAAGQSAARGNALVDTASADATAAAAISIAADEKKREAESACPAKMRESAETWMTCISDLREDGRDDLADSEFEEFQRIFPNFVESKAHK